MFCRDRRSFVALGGLFALMAMGTTSCTKKAPLHEAALAGDTKAVREVLASGVDVDAKDRKGRTALQRAVWRGHKDAVELLIEKGADVNAKFPNHITALHLVADKGYQDLAELLISKGAEVDAKTKDGLTPLFMALSRNHIDMAKLLLKHGANPKDPCGPYRETPLHMAVRTRDKDLVAQLIAQGADVNAKTEDDYTPLLTALEWNSLEVAELLRKHGAKE